MADRGRHRAHGLGGVRAVKSPPAPTTIAHGVLVGWSAARIEQRGRVWKVGARARRRSRAVGGSGALRAWLHRAAPDLAVWVKRSAPPVAVIAESGGAPRGSPEDDPRGVARRDLVRPLRGCAIRLRQPIRRALDHPPGQEGRADRSDFTAAVQTTAEQIAALSPAAPEDEPAFDEATSPANPNRRLAMRSKLHPRQRRNRSNSHRPSHRRHRSPRRPRPRRSASGATARSSAWTRSPPPMAPSTLTRSSPVAR